MKQLTIVICAGLFALIGWQVIGHISSDALGLAIGVVFGVLAGLPTAVLVLASGNREIRQIDEVPAPPAFLPSTDYLIITDVNTGKTYRIDTRLSPKNAIEVKR